jgi:hypothetical protein
MEPATPKLPEASASIKKRPLNGLWPLPGRSTDIDKQTEIDHQDPAPLWSRLGLLPLTIVTTLAAMGVSLAITSGTYLWIDPSRIKIASILAVVCPMVIAPPMCIFWFKLFEKYQRTQRQLIRTNQELAEALSQVKELTGLLPICSVCKRIRDDQGYWTQLEAYLTKNSRAEFTHGICPECSRKLYPELTVVTEDETAHEK